MNSIPYPYETNSLGVNGNEYHGQYSREKMVDWTDPSLARITRLRLLTDPGFPLWDVSYCHGELNDGTKVHVQLPFSQLNRRTWWGDIKYWAKIDGVNLYKLKVWDSISKLW